MNHRHHIVPRYAGGDNSPENIAILTVEEHARAHLELWLANKDRRDLIAYRMLSGQITGAEATRLAGIEANRGRKLSDETRRRMSLAHRRRHEAPTARMVEGRAKAAATRRDRRRPIETAERQMKGPRRHSAETRRKMSESWTTERRMNNPLKGRSRPPEVRSKISASRMGHVVSEATRTKISEARRAQRKEAGVI